MKRLRNQSLPFASPNEIERSDLPRLEAVGDVILECKPRERAAAHRFYAELIGFRERPLETQDETDLCFSSQLLRLRLRVTPDALPSPNRRRALIRVASLAFMVERLNNEGYPCQMFRGFSYFDRWVLVLDPAGNLVELREERRF